MTHGWHPANIFLRRCLTVAAFVVLLLGAAPGKAQDEAPELVTDRPDQTESAAIVPPGSVQLELGGLFVHDDADGRELDVVEVPGTLVRIGLLERLELRVGWAGWVSVDAGFADASGLGDAALGVKYRLRDEQGGAPEMAVLAAASLPVGDEAFTSDRVDPSLRLAFAHTLSERHGLGLGYNVGVAWESGGGEAGEVATLSRFLYTLSLSIAVRDGVNAFVELFGETGGSAGGGPASSFDGGFTFRLRDNVQFDVAGGVGLSDGADDWFVGIGLSVRWPR